MLRKSHITLAIALFTFCVMSAAAGQSNDDIETKDLEPACHISEFKSLCRANNNTLIRKQKSFEWLKANLSNCSLGQLIHLRNRRSSWLGSAESVLHVSLIDDAIRSKKAS